mmetsp:Transcript_39661/g.88758  ORF Transcript_39661/g.88758 Transcript_39661/m.88758 type:complete len:184 (+) Transcript_39661:132-683(+)
MLPRQLRPLSRIPANLLPGLRGVRYLSSEGTGKKDTAAPEGNHVVKSVPRQASRSELRAHKMAPIDSIDSSSTTNTRFSDAMRYKNLENIMEQNSRWMEQINEKDPEFFNRLGAGHNPRYLWIGCADARVPANEIMSEGAGSVFVHRNVGNQVGVLLMRMRPVQLLATCCYNASLPGYHLCRC